MFVTTAIFNITCTIIIVIIPIPINEPDFSLAYTDIYIPLITKIPNNNITAKHPTNPNSSAIIANIKSLCASGIYKYFCLLFPNPTPNNPPDPIAYKL